MAALVNRQPLLRQFYSALKVGNVVKYSSLPQKKKPPQRKPGPKIYHETLKLGDRGYLRPLRAYVPPDNVESQLYSILTKHIDGMSEIDPTSEINEPLTLFKILQECFEIFKHGVPNSQLYKINTVRDLAEFYMTPVDNLTPLEHLKLGDMPPNLHIDLEPKRFDPDEANPIAGGISAFPSSPTVYTTLHAKKKFKPIPAQNWTKDWREKGLGYIKW